jgi:glycosyltransferase involved in cell wall biosynthesis
MASLRVCIDARLNGVPGGVLSYVIGLASGLSALPEGDEEYLFLAYSDCHDWLKPHVSGACRLLMGERLGIKSKRKFFAKVPFALTCWRGLRGLQRTLGRQNTRPTSIPASDGLIEREHVEVMHFAHQAAFLTEVPTIYQPMDLQHLHLAEYFSEAEIQSRETLYRTFCNRASVVIAGSEWGRQDLITHYGLAPEKVWAVAYSGSSDDSAPPTREAIEECRRVFRLPAEFAFFPAQTMPHKNHLGLLEALALIRDRQATVPPLVCCGHKTAYFGEVWKKVRTLGLESSCRFLGTVSSEQIRCLYRMCKMVVFPTKFEGFGIPIVEAFNHGAPLACSSVSCLPEIAGDAALLFDPYSPESMAEAIDQLWNDEPLRKDLVRRGERRTVEFTWERIAKQLRAHYRRLASRPLTEEDRRLTLTPSMALAG